MNTVSARRLLGAAVVSMALGQPAQAGMLAIDLAGALYSISETTAVATLIGGTGLTGAGSLEFAADGTLYTHRSGASSALFTVNPTTAASAVVGGLGVGFVFEGGIAFSPAGTAYATNQGSAAAAQLMTLNLATGAATIVGSTSGTAPDRDINGLAWRSDGMLIGLDRGTDSLVIINPATAAVTNLAAVPSTLGNSGGMAVLNGVGYYANAVPTGLDELYSFDLFTGASTLIGEITGMTNEVSGLAAEPANGTAPAPGVAALLGIGLLAGALARRRRA